MNSFCDIEQISETLFKCKVCGYKYKEVFKKDCISLINKCKPEKINEHLFRCTECGFSHSANFDRECLGKTIKPAACIHQGEFLRTLDTKECGCSGRGTSVEVFKCNKFGVECGAFSLLKWDKRQELKQKGALSCGECPERDLGNGTINQIDQKV